MAHFFYFLLFFAPSMGTCHKSRGIEHLLMYPYLCVKTEIKFSWDTEWFKPS